MTNIDDQRLEIQALRERLSKLSEAGLRISESLDVDTVLHEVVKNACVLTGAGSGGITTMDSSGKLQDFVTFGVSAEEYQQYVTVPYGPSLWEYLRQVQQPLRIRDLSAHLVSLGFPEDPMLPRSYLGVPIRHQGVHIGIFNLADKEEGEEFTSEDTEILVLFASQAGAAIANARKHQDERRTRADLEALIDTSPVGVVVFDARNGKVGSLNQESRRIVGDLCKTGQSAEELLEIVNVHRADGQEIALEESPLAQALCEATTIRAEEIILEVPDGRKIRTLINATPIRSDQGHVESVVVTMQDMTPLEELERLRAEFMGMVSHELRAPLVSIKGCTATVLGTSAVQDPTETQQFFRIIDEQADHMRALISDLLDAAYIETGTLSISPEPAELAVMVEQARNTFLSGRSGNPISIDLPTDLPRVRADRHRIVQVLVNLLSNAARHVPEASAIKVLAAREGVHVAVSVVDEGRGIPAERLPHLFRKFTRSGREDRGRGVGEGLGLAICKGLVEAHGGRIWADSEGEGLGTRFTFTIPVIEEAATGIEETPVRRQGLPFLADRKKPCVLVVDDDPQALGHIRGILEDAGFATLVTGDPKEVSGLIETRQPDLILLDLLLPDIDGIELMQSVPAMADQPVIFLSAYGRDETIARALEIGAVDYVVKPFSPTELVARIQSALRRNAGPPEPFQAGDLIINYEERRVALAGSPIKLTATEYDLLRILSTNAGRVVTYDFLLRSLWRSSKSGDARVVRAFVKKLRSKLDDNAGSPTYIFTESRVGYRMARPEEIG